MENERISVYMITMFRDFSDDYGIEDSRTMGFYSTFEVAERSVEINNLNIHECIYNYGVIEKVVEGLYPCTKERWFYKYDRENDKFYNIEEPECVKNLINLWG